MWRGEAADRRRIGDPPGAPREPGCPAWAVLGVKALEMWCRCRLSAPFREVTFCASYKCHCFGVKGGRLSWFRG